VNEEDTVNVGQEIARLELGGAPAEGQKQTEPKEEKSAPAEESQSEPAKDSKPDGPASSAGSQQQEGTSAPKEKAQTPSTTSEASAEAPRQTSPPKQETKPQPKPQAKDEQSQAAAREPPLGKREERRVSCIRCPTVIEANCCSGENEPDASSHCGAIEAVAEYGRFPDDL
jgi:2-oxoglutarate dehydrogenase E2 component (dihydrolipoamide succinyltransferase)